MSGACAPHENPAVGVHDWLAAGVVLALQSDVATVVPSERRHVTLRVCVVLSESASQLAVRDCAVIPQPAVGIHPE